MKQEQLSEISALLQTPSRIAITMHQKPDGDAIGSSLGLYHYLIQKGHQVKVVAPTEYPDFLKWLPGSDQVIIGPTDPDGANWAFEGADIIFCLDFNSLHRINEFEKSVADAMGKVVMIDHHLEPTDFADLMYWDDTASSAAELIHRLVVALGDKALINQDMAYPLYTGLMTDTGSFRFKSTTPAVHAMAGNLLETGINVTAIHDRIYSQFDPERLKFFGYCLLNCLHILPEYETAYIKLERQVFKDFNVKTGGTEGLVNYALGIKGIKMGVLISEHNELVKLSFRSREEVSAKDYAEHFNGGGHFYASGGRSHSSLDETEQILIDLLAKNYQAALDEKPQLT